MLLFLVMLGNLQPQQREYTIAEDQLEVRVCWNLNSANLTLERSLDFFVTTQSISATEADFSGVARIATLMPTVPSNLELCVNVDIHEDQMIENQEMFMLILNSMDSAVTTFSTSQVCI